MDERQHTLREARPKLADVSPQQAESFAILRRPQVESDRLPASRWRLRYASQYESGLGLAIARRAERGCFTPQAVTPVR